jgi:uncharacterized protein (DUF4213/DUF364 family)
MMAQDEKPAENHSELEARNTILLEAAAAIEKKAGAALDAIRIERAVVGVFFTGVKLSTGAGGVAYTPPESIDRASTRILRSKPYSFRDAPVREVMHGLASHPFAGLMQLATLNALSVPYFDEYTAEGDAQSDVSDDAQLFRGRKVCMVGAILPLLKKMRSLGVREMLILDKKKETEVDPELGTRINPEQAEAALGNCDTAVLTGATIANGSFPELLRMIPRTSAVVVAGPTAGFLPVPLFERGVALVGTVAVIEPDHALDILSEGGGGYQLFSTCVRKINLANEARLRELGM